LIVVLQKLVLNPTTSQPTKYGPTVLWPLRLDKHLSRSGILPTQKEGYDAGRTLNVFLNIWLIVNLFSKNRWTWNSIPRLSPISKKTSVSNTSLQCAYK
jgi:hypothetical protein